ncbi:hypothetical protein TGAMA5MH_03534 [Trichoderma gamsii]|uniref:Uncharacterized protein n=1 Tax=Trichoderma gamsii TaxID=398673 RepID=A0A2K0TGS7_9HYPO|nr:hypothetical protein TGAMA5MH_03534 [Trichoderma gamsii]
MESSRLGLLRSHSKARSGKLAGSQNKADVPPAAEPEDAAKEAAKEEKHEKSRSWFSPRRKDSVASTILRSSKSFRRLSAVSSAASSQAAISTPTTPSFSRGSYESDAAFHHRKLSPLENSEALISEPAPTDPPSIPYPPHRPERPQGDLFEGTPLEKANQLDTANPLEKANQQSHRPSRSRSILRPFSPFPGPSIRDLRRLSQHSEHKLQANNAADADTTTSKANRLSTETEQVHEPADVAMTPASPKPSTYSVLSAPAPIVPNRRTSLRPSSKGSEAGVTRKPSIASSFHFSIHRRPSHVTADIESRKHVRSSRWTLTENMADMFKGQHIKTDKQTMTPAQIEAIWNGQDNGGGAAAAAKQKQKKGKERRMKAASDTSASISRSFGGPLTEQQNNLFSDPFQRSGKMSSPVPMSRADIKMRHLPFEIAVPPPPSAILGSPEIFHGDVSPKSPTKVDRSHMGGRHSVPRLVLPDSEDVAIEDDDDAVSASSIPIPPKNPARFVARAPTMPLLPPILEGFRSPSGSNRSSNISSHRRSRSCNHASEVKDDMITFTSTPYTMANPSFRHGPIVLSDASSRDSVTTAEAVEEEGEAVDLSTLSGEPEEKLGHVIPKDKALPDEEEGKMADDMADWYDGLNLGSPGELISVSEKSSEKQSDRSTQRDSAGSMTSAASTPSTVQTEAEAELQTPVAISQHPSLFDSIVQFRSGCESTYSASVYDEDSDGEMSRNEIDELAPSSVASKQAMEHGYEAFLGFSLDDSY